MIRIKLFALFIAFALLALVRPRKCLELLEAADAGAAGKQAQSEIEIGLLKIIEAKEKRHEAELKLAQLPPAPKRDADVDRAYDEGVADGKVLMDEERRKARMAIVEFRHFRKCGGRFPVDALEILEQLAFGKKPAQECPLPPAGWRCTRRAGHDGPCAAVVK